MSYNLIPDNVAPTSNSRNKTSIYHIMRKIIIALLMLLPAFTSVTAQETKANDYLAGAVPTVNGCVVFKQTYQVPGKTQSEIFTALKNYTITQVLEGPNHLPQARITEADSLNGTLAASMDEYLYFKRTKWQIHRVHFYYQLVFEVKNGSFDVTMRNIHYKYDPEANPGGMDADYRAENWITDEAALTKDGKRLARISGKFRKNTIDRKNELFKEAARAAGVKFKTRTIEVED